jgi:flagellar biosynthesis protein
MTMQKAIALAWSGMEEAPVILAHGHNELAEKMLDIAQTCGIEIVSDPLLADILDSSAIGSCIPPETWGTVASIFAFLEKGIQDKWFL